MRSAYTLVEVLIGVVIAGIIGFFIFFIAELCTSHVEYSKGQVLARSYAPSSSTTGSGVDANGKPVITHHYESEKWIVIVACEGQTIPVETNSAYWTTAEQGQWVTVGKRVGGIFGMVISYGIYPAER